jgi:methyl-accepting chemotaxis protein
MDFDEAIHAHAAWKIVLSNYLERIDGTLTAAQARVDNRCSLGRWLYGEGKKYSSVAEYQILISEHARFHHVAGEVIDRANSGKDVDPDRILHSDSEYEIASGNVVKAIMELKSKVTAAA